MSLGRYCKQERHGLCRGCSECPCHAYRKEDWAEEAAQAEAERLAAQANAEAEALQQWGHR